MKNTSNQGSSHGSNNSSNHGSNQGSNQRRGRGRNTNKPRHGNSRTSNHDSNGPEGKVRGTAQQVLDKYLSLARDATSAGEHIAAEGFYQFAEHYYRVLHADDNKIQNNNTQRNQSQNPQPAHSGEGEQPSIVTPAVTQSETPAVSEDVKVIEIQPADTNDSGAEQSATVTVVDVPDAGVKKPKVRRKRPKKVESVAKDSIGELPLDEPQQDDAPATEPDLAEAG